MGHNRELDAEFQKRLTEWCRDSGIEQKEYTVRQLQQTGKHAQAASLRAEVMALAQTAARQIWNDIEGSHKSKAPWKRAGVERVRG